MSVRPKTKKPSRKVRQNSGVVVESFSQDCFFAFTDSVSRPPLETTVGASKNGTARRNGEVNGKRPSVQDRRYLRDMEVWLNNCVNFAERLHAKEAAKILHLLREARERTVKLRG